MKKQLSGRLTILVKIIIPGFWILVWSGLGLMMLIEVDERNQMPPAFFFVFGILFTAMLYFAAMRYMKVAVDTKYLYVSNYLREISIPLSNIRDVTEIGWVRGHPVHNSSKSAVGFWQQNSVFAEIARF